MPRKNNSLSDPIQSYSILPSPILYYHIRSYPFISAEKSAKTVFSYFLGRVFDSREFSKFIKQFFTVSVGNMRLQRRGIWSDPILLYPIQPYAILSFPIRSYPLRSYLYPIGSNQILSYPIRLYPITPDPIRPYYTLSNPICPKPFLSLCSRRHMPTKMVFDPIMSYLLRCDTILWDRSSLLSDPIT